MVSIDESLTALRETIETHFEWLVVYSEGRTFPLQLNEIEIDDVNEKILLGMPGDKGFRKWRVRDAAFADNEIQLELVGQFGSDEQSVRLIPRTPAAEFAHNIELARLIRANEIAALIESSFPGTKIVRVALNDYNGRMAQILIETGPKVQSAVLADVTKNLTSENLLASAVLWLDRLNSRRNRPIQEVWIVGEKKQARALRKLHSLLNERSKPRIKIIEIFDEKNEPKLRHLEPQLLRSLWREKPRKLVLPQGVEASDLARKIVDAAPDQIDAIRSKQGETLRYLGLPFTRVRTILGQERSWFGISKKQRPLLAENFDAILELIDEMACFRRSDSPNPRHEYYRTSPESWLESILRRNIKLLDANLILSPIYTQFRAASDKIDLLAIRKDGRLVIIELKTSPDRDMVFQAADYWRKIELQRRRGELAKARLFGDLEILDKPALVYAVAPALSFHHNFEYFAQMLAPEIELWRFELHEEWRREVKVISRVEYGKR
jgi:hypothetical protein